MPLVRVTLVILISWCLFGDEKPLPQVAPVYIAASIVNAADNQSGLAPNTIGTIYGTNLAYSTHETQVLVDNLAAYLYYVSPTQINFLVPPNLLAQAAVIQVVIDGLAGPAIPLTLAPAAPGLFQLYLPNSNDVYAVTTRPDGSLLTQDSPAKPGDIVLLWATGLGETIPPAIYDELPTAAAPLIAGSNFSILLDGVPVGPYAIYYAGVAPGFAGLYQINLILPGSTGSRPEIRLLLDGATSIPKVYLPVSAP